MITKLLNKLIYSHGKEFCSCTFCDEMLTIEKPGHRVAYVEGGKKLIEHTCPECFHTPAYQALIKYKSFKHGMDIRLFPLWTD